jgi:Zn-finger nucleic acid-binding protein
MSDRELNEAFARAREDQNRNLHIVPEGQRPCPICGRLMETQSRHNHIVDVCHEHGIWLDKDELPAIMARLRQRQRDDMRRARRDGKMSGALWGWWSLLFD